MIIFRPVYQGIREHFPIRLSEWIMTLPTFGMWLGFQIQPDMFTTSPSFDRISALADEATWAIIVLACGVVRLAALTVNGTFQDFRFSPHMRFVASLVGLLFWSRYTFGFVDAFMTAEGSFSAIVAYSTFCAMELANLYRSGGDVGKEIDRIEIRKGR